jgi:asparagine synthase (glutamine-hydrolysing)
MCGLAGYIDFNQKTERGVIDAMVRTMGHRGPDHRGFDIFSLEDATIGLGHARLSIIDLSPSGNQPMHYHHLSIVYNGEIYNYTVIKKQLVEAGHHFQTTSDTEVILHAYEQWGVRAVEYFIGMFVIVIFDRKRDEIVLLRDRPGVKPLYYYQHDGLFLFASELKAFHAHPQFQKQINAGALALYFDFGYIPAPYTIFKNCHKLEPGHTLRLDLKTRDIKIETYWDIRVFYTKPKQNIHYQESREQIHDLLKSACEYRMVSDVPVGVFLSGGYDSAVVTAILQKDRTEKLKTFTIGFAEGNNEAPFAKETARYLGTDHTEYICTSKEAQDIIPTLPLFYDEPFADSSAIPTTLVSRLARQKVTVALSADGGDELFAGYELYWALADKLALLNLVPGILKGAAKPLLKFAATLLPNAALVKKHKAAGIAASVNRNHLQQDIDLFRSMKRMPEVYAANVLLNRVKRYPTKYNINPAGFHHEIEVAMAADYKGYLQNDILTKVDRATMSVSLEGREPLLDHRMAEYVATLPYDYKCNGTTAKRILKDIVHKYIPKKILDRPKTGFSMPISSWLRGDLSYLLEEYLSETALGESSLLNASFLTKQVNLFKDEKLHYTPFIWKLLMFQMWHRRWMN